MSDFFKAVDKIKPAYDATYKFVLLICKLLLIGDIAITTMAVAGRYISFIPDPAWSEEIVLTFMAYMAVLSAALAIRRGAHIRMTAFDPYLPKSVVRFLDVLSDVAVLILAVVMICLLYTSDAAEICYEDWCKGYLCKYAGTFKILAVLPDTFSRCCNVNI